MPAPVRLLVSILSLGRPENVLRQLACLPDWLSDAGLSAEIVIRNNDPAIGFDSVADRVAEIDALYPEIGASLVTNVPNNGFGAGHNGNIATCASDFVLILNDDIGFPHMAWLAEAIAMLERDSQMAAVAAEENPRYLNPVFGNGLLPGSFHLQQLSYGEASILLCRRAALEAAGGFHEDYAWAMCEDADLSLRWQQLGYTIGYVAMPHEHWRSSSFNSLPGQVKSSILEHNRAALFANWRESLAAGTVGRFDVFDLWSDGLGDVFCALPHVLARLSSMTAAQRANVIINTNHPKLVAWLGLTDIRLEAEKDLPRLRQALSSDGIAALRTTRETNFALPFNIHPLLAGSLGIAAAGQDILAAFHTRLQALPAPPRLPTIAGKAVILHTEFGREHDGRGLSPLWSAKLLDLCTGIFDTVILVGQERRLVAPSAQRGSAGIVDLQGKLSLAQLAGIMARATCFVGIDSFPSHLAQALQLPSAIFFGAVHPLTRVWNRARVWPLLAQLDCLGCYHTQLEPSVPFCMRRDRACTSQLEEERLGAVLRAMAEGQPYDWAALDLSLQSLQARLIKLAKFHPAPPQRLFRGNPMPNEAVSNMIYRMTDQLGELLRGQYQTSTVNALTGQVQDLQSQVFAAKVQLDAAQRSLQEKNAVPSSVTGWDRLTPALLHLGTLPLEAVRCRLTLKDKWIEIEATDDDPQLLLPPIHGRDGKVQLRLSCLAGAEEALQIYWAFDDEPFSPEKLRTVPMEAGAAAVNLVMEVAHGQVLRLRIDPITGLGNARLHGSIAGVFSFETAAAPNGADDLAIAASEASHGRRKLAARSGRRSAVH